MKDLILESCGIVCNKEDQPYEKYIKNLYTRSKCYFLSFIWLNVKEFESFNFFVYDLFSKHLAKLLWRFS